MHTIIRVDKNRPTFFEETADEAKAQAFYYATAPPGEYVVWLTDGGKVLSRFEDDGADEALEAVEAELVKAQEALEKTSEALKKAHEDAQSRKRLGAWAEPKESL